MKLCIFSVIGLLAISALSCTQPSVDVNPTSSIGSGRGGSPNPPTTPTSPTYTTLPDLTPNPNPIYDLGPVMPSGPWTVKSSIRGGSDATADFAGCSIMFYSGGFVTVTDSKGKSTSGSWSATVGGQILYYGSGPSVTSLTINFGKKASKPFDRLTNTWNVNLSTTTNDVVLDNFEPLAIERIELAQ